MDNISYSKHVSAAEQKLLAAILSGCLPVTDLESSDIDLFSEEQHKAIFKIILLYGPIDSNGIDTVLFFQLALQQGLDQKIGGTDYIHELLGLPITKYAVREYLDIVAEAATKRKLSALITDVHQELAHPKSNSEQISNKLMDGMVDINNLYKHKTFEPIQTDVDLVISEALYKMKHHVPYSGLGYGFKSLDEITGGLAKGELSVIAGRPGMGKTAFALSLLYHVGAIQKKAAAFLTLEINTTQVVKRMLSSLSGISFGHIDRGSLTEDEAKTLLLNSEKLNDAKIFIIDQAPSSVFEIAQVIRRLKHKKNVELLIIDDIQLLNLYRHNNYSSREQEISKICNLLKQYAQKLNISIVILSQLSRATETRGGARRPILSDLRDSGALEENADKVLFIYRPEYYGLIVDEDNEPTKGRAEIIVAKNKTGPVEVASLRFIAQTASFMDIEPLEDSFEDYIERRKAEKNIKSGNDIFKPFNSKTENQEDAPW